MEREKVVEIIAIGNELLEGKITNTNATFLSRALSDLGLKIKFHQVFPDEAKVIEEGLTAALDRSALVITTGGLGPTLDDLTIPCVAKVFDSPLAYNQEVANELTERYKTHLISLENQATLPVKATVLPNKMGTACGLYFEEKGRRLIVLPGVPHEMRHLYETEVIPIVRTVFGIQKPHLRETLLFAGLSEGLIAPHLQDLVKEDPVLEVGSYPSLGILSILLKRKEGEEHLYKAKKRLIEQFHSYYLSDTDASPEETLFNLLKKRGKTLALAESCTGGAVAARLVQVSGISSHFLGSLVCYSNEMKERFLKVSPQIIKEHGAVSEECARAMLSGLLEETKADWGGAITGIAGPHGGTKEKPVGTVWVAVGEKGKPAFVKQLLNYPGDRKSVIERSVNALLATLILHIS